MFDELRRTSLTLLPPSPCGGPLPPLPVSGSSNSISSMSLSSTLFFGLPSGPSEDAVGPSEGAVGPSVQVEAKGPT